MTAFIVVLVLALVVLGTIAFFAVSAAKKRGPARGGAVGPRTRWSADTVSVRSAPPRRSYSGSASSNPSRSSIDDDLPLRTATTSTWSGGVDTPSHHNSSGGHGSSDGGSSFSSDGGSSSSSCD